MADNTYLEETRLLNYNHKDIAELTDSRGWAELESYDKIGAAYHFVKDEIAFGYNESDDIPASKVLSDRYGQCNTKAILLMALLRRLGVPCRIHGFRVDKKVQEGIVPEPFYRRAPSTLLHTWAEIEREGRWVSLEGCILDQDYLSAVQSEWSMCKGGLCGYGVAVADVQNAEVEWKGEHTYIQVDSIVEGAPGFISVRNSGNCSSRLLGLLRLTLDCRARAYLTTGLYKRQFRGESGSAGSFVKEYPSLEAAAQGFSARGFVCTRCEADDLSIFPVRWYTMMSIAVSSRGR